MSSAHRAIGLFSLVSALLVPAVLDAQRLIPKVTDDDVKAALTELKIPFTQPKPRRFELELKGMLETPDKEIGNLVSITVNTYTLQFYSIVDATPSMVDVNAWNKEEPFGRVTLGSDRFWFDMVQITSGGTTDQSLRDMISLYTNAFVKVVKRLGRAPSR